MQYELSVKVGNREVYRSAKPRKISMVTDISAAVVKELDAAPNSVNDWESMSIRIVRE